MTEAREMNQSQAVNALLVHYAEGGRLIGDLPPLVGRKVDTLKVRARKLGLEFPDYKPRKIDDGTEK
jgi:hypothetical protein